MSDPYDADRYDWKHCPGNCEECEFDPEKSLIKEGLNMGDGNRRREEIQKQEEEAREAWGLPELDGPEWRKLFVYEGEIQIITDRDRAVMEYQRNLLMDYLPMILNMLLEIHPITYEEFNRVVVTQPGVQEKALLSLEENYPAIGITKVGGLWGWSTLSLIATITEILVGDRLAFLIDTPSKKGGRLYACEWYNRDSIPRQNFLNWITPKRWNTTEIG